MGEMLMKLIYFLFVLPIIIFQEGWARLKKLLDAKGWWRHIPYFLLALLCLLLLMAWGAGYRW
jgi:hypothetical protein